LNAPSQTHALHFARTLMGLPCDMKKIMADRAQTQAESF